MSIQPIYLGMQLRGARVDPWKREQLLDKFTTERNEAIDRLSAFVGSSIMAKKAISNQKLATLLYDKLGLPRQFHHKTHKLTVSKEALEKLENHVDDSQRPIFLDVLRVRNHGVLIQTFLTARLDADNRFRWSTNQAGTKTGRLSTSGSPFWTGGNIQNWKESVRDIIVSDPGKVFVYCDGEQAEARIVAKLARDPALDYVFSSGQHIHAQMATRIFGIPLAQTPEEIDALKARKEYKDSKIGVHASNYDMTYRRAALVMRCTEAHAKGVLERVHLEFPGIRGNFHAGVEAQLRQNRTLTSPFGRRREFFGRWNKELLKQAFAQIPQSTIGDWTQFGTIRLVNFSQGDFEGQHASYNHKLARYWKLPELRFAPSYASLVLPVWPVSNQHDGLLVQVLLEDLERGIALMREAMTYEIVFSDGDRVVVPVDIKVGRRWGSLKAPTSENLNKIWKGDL